MTAIWVLTQEDSISESEVKGFAKRKLDNIVELNRYNTCYSAALCKYLGAMLYSVSGNLVWSIYCLRYKSSVS